MSTWMKCIWYPKQAGVMPASTWYITTTSDRPERDSIVVADFMSEAVARHVAQLHNEWWLTRTDDDE